jgi:hypothetical protein
MVDEMVSDGVVVGLTLEGSQIEDHLDAIEMISQIHQ